MACHQVRVDFPKVFHQRQGAAPDFRQNDIGFRVDSSKDKDGGVAGTLVVQIGGRWVKASSVVAAVPATGSR